MTMLAKTGVVQLLEHIVRLGVQYLDHYSQLLVEQQRKILSTQFVQLDADATAAGKGHFTDRDEQPTVGTVMIGQQLLIPVHLLDQLEEALEGLRIDQIRAMVTQLPVDLGQRRGAQSVLPLTQVDQDQVRIAQVGSQLRSQGAAHIADRGKGGDDQRQRRGHRPLFALLLPDGLHRHGVFADRDGDPQGRTKLHAHRPHGFVEFGILAVVPGRRHPVGGEFDVTEPVDTGGRDVGQRLADGHAPGGRPVDQRQGGTLAHRHGLAGVTHRDRSWSPPDPPPAPARGPPSDRAPPCR